jgi:hypothetical protein
MSLCRMKQSCKETLRWGGGYLWLHLLSITAVGMGKVELGAPASLPQECTSGTHWLSEWVGFRSRLNAMEKRKIPCGYRQPDPNFSIVQSVAKYCNYIEWTILTSLTPLNWWNPFQTITGQNWEQWRKRDRSWRGGPWNREIVSK